MRSNLCEFQPNLGGHPERMREEGVKVHGNELVKIGDLVEAIGEVAGKIPKGAKLKVINFIIEPQGNVRGFHKRLVLEGFDDDFNPQRFRKIIDKNAN